MRHLKILLIALMLLLMTDATQAQFLKSGDIRVYASAVVSDQLNEKVADEYGITRSASRVLLHVVAREGEPGKDKALAAEIMASATRPDRSKIDINMQRTESSNDVFYLGDVSIAKNEALNFEIIIKVSGHEPMRMTFYQAFYTP
jgi:Domain of unknown function (DUF4426)